MPIQEGYVHSAAELERPCGVLFEPPCSTRDQDLQAWRAILPMLESEWKSGREIMVLVQTRQTRLWDNNKRNYDFSYQEDYLVAAYSLAPSVGQPYTPGLCANIWLDGIIDAASNQGSPAIYQVFECSPKGCRLTKMGVMQLITFHQKQGAGRAEAIVRVKDGHGDAQKFGWIGGCFPARWTSSIRWRSARRSASG